MRLSDDELEELVRVTHPAHLATVSPSGEPHVTPIGVVMLSGALYMVSMVRSRRMRDIERGCQVSLCIDHWGDVSAEHQGAIFYGRCELAPDDDRTRTAVRMFAEKYYGDPDAPASRSGTHRWIRLVPDRVVTWDFRKIPAGADRVSGPSAAEPTAP
ncbi:MAG: pyridoxamine 5'-phosphate oxidase family protein [Acidimicrobiia bacterium]